MVRGSLLAEISVFSPTELSMGSGLAFVGLSSAHVLFIVSHLSRVSIYSRVSGHVVFQCCSQFQLVIRLFRGLWSHFGGSCYF